jgi:hypothetical protein
VFEEQVVPAGGRLADVADDAEPGDALALARRQVVAGLVVVDVAERALVLRRLLEKRLLAARGR